jgi:hypothetical protein
MPHHDNHHDAHEELNFDPTELPLYMQVVYICTGILAFAASIASIRLIATHLMEFRQPPVQRKIVGILWIVPIYALTSWLSLRYLHASLYLDLVRDTYEAFVLYLFFSFCTCLIAADEQCGSMEEQAVNMEKFLLSEGKNLQWFLSCKRGLLQYLLAKPMSTVLAISMTACGYGDAWEAIYPFVASILCVLGCVALYWLGLYYFLVKYRLKHHNILGKFLSIKFIIFLTFWQGVILQILQWCGVLHDFRLAFVEFRSYSSATIAQEVQNCLICLEMFIISFVHAWTFPVAPFVETSPAETRVTPAFGDALGYKNTFDDLRLLWRLDPQLQTIMNVPGHHALGGNPVSAGYGGGSALPATQVYVKPDPLQINYRPLNDGGLPSVPEVAELGETLQVMPKDAGEPRAADPLGATTVYPGLRRDTPVPRDLPTK